MIKVTVSRLAVPTHAQCSSRLSWILVRLSLCAAMLLSQSIEHRGYWYYIDDTDPVSKHLFSTIVDAYTSRIGLKTTEDKVPQLVLPISGG
jgi:hypothetical protein